MYEENPKNQGETNIAVAKLIFLATIIATLFACAVVTIVVLSLNGTIDWHIFSNVIENLRTPTAIP
jgi:hypothetical protein